MSIARDASPESSAVLVFPALMYFCPSQENTAYPDPYAVRIRINNPETLEQEAEDAINAAIEGEYNTLVSNYIKLQASKESIRLESKAKREKLIISNVYNGDKAAFDFDKEHGTSPEKQKQMVAINVSVKAEAEDAVTSLDKQITALKDEMDLCYAKLLTKYDPEFMKLKLALEKAKIQNEKMLEPLFLEKVKQAMADFGVSDEIFDQIQIIIAGSVAKGMETPFSDIDSFMILPDSLEESDKEKIMAAARALTTVSNNLNIQQVNQFIMDPFTFSLSGMMSGKKEYVLSTFKSKYDEDKTMSVAFGGRVIHGEKLPYYKDILSKTREHILEHGMILERMAYFRSEKEKSRTEVKNIKKDLIQPFTHALLLLRRCAHPDLQDDKFLILENLIPALEEKKIITPSQKEEFLKLRTELFNERRDMHKRENQESDEIKPYISPEHRKKLQKWLVQSKKLEEFSESYYQSLVFKIEGDPPLMVLPANVWVN